MVGDISQMGPGVSLWWALLSAAVGMALVVFVVARVWREHRQMQTKRCQDVEEVFGDGGDDKVVQESSTGTRGIPKGDDLQSEMHREGQIGEDRK